ncbi:hypothetical protein [Rothia nasimurium]|uniref:hypothetical protein n=1 Tax=Rothia nasimurium TaxID=85336 RepID=UPI001F468861|nr:hypothetical protein [Rothia nasimurium]
MPRICQIISAATLEGGSLAERVAAVFTWMLALNTEDRELCARELIDTARAAFATNQPKTLLVGVTIWFESATALAAGLDQVEAEWLTEPVPAEAP